MHRKLGTVFLILGRRRMYVGRDMAKRRAVILQPFVGNATKRNGFRNKS